MEVDILQMLIQYGIAGAALYMMYSITFNHLQAISATLSRIEGLLEKS